MRTLQEELVRALTKFMELEPQRAVQLPYEMAVYDTGRAALERAKREGV